jgi:phage/plasmid-associated DNA primase
MADLKQIVQSKFGIEPNEKMDWAYLESKNDEELWNNIVNYLGFKPYHRCDVISIPYYQTSGEPVKMVNGNNYGRFRMIESVQMPDGKKSPKYLSPKGSGVHVYISQSLPKKWIQQSLGDRNIPLVVFEGEGKAEYAAQLLMKYCKESDAPLYMPIGIAGVQAWSKKNTYNSLGDVSYLNFLANHPNAGVREKLESLDKAETQELIEVLTAWEEKHIIETTVRKNNSKPVQDMLFEWVKDEDYPEYEEAFNWNLDEELENLQVNGTKPTPRKLANFQAHVRGEIAQKLQKAQNKRQIHPEISQFKLNGRQVVVAFDSDIVNSGIDDSGYYAADSIAGAARAFCLELSANKAVPTVMVLPNPVKFPLIKGNSDCYSDPTTDTKVGYDDYGMMYGSKAAIDALMAAIKTKRDCLIPNNDMKPGERTDLSTYKLSLELTIPEIETYLANFLKYRVNIAYRDNVGLYKWTGKYWERITTEFFEETLSRNYYNSIIYLSKNKTKRFIKNQIRELIAVTDTCWGQLESQWVLYRNGKYNFYTQEFVEGFVMGDYFTKAPVDADYKEFSDIPFNDIEQVINFINTYSEGDDKFLQYILASIRWTVTPKAPTKKLQLEKMFSLVGGQGTGKSTFLEMLKYAVGLPNTHQFTKSKLARPEDLHNYRGKSLLSNSDTSGGITKDAVESLNKIISGETLETRALFKESINTDFRAVIWVAGNESLTYGITGTQGMDRRLVTIPFERKRTNTEDRTLHERVTSPEWQTALFWLYRQINHDDMISILNHTRYLPTSISSKTQAQSRERNPIRQFWIHLEEKWSEINRTEEGFTGSTLSLEYREWVKISGINEYSETVIVNQMKSMGAIETIKKADGTSKRSSQGVKYRLLPYQDQTSSESRLTIDVDNGRPLILVDAKAILDNSPEVTYHEEEQLLEVSDELKSGVFESAESDGKLIPEQLRQKVSSASSRGMYHKAREVSKIIQRREGIEETAGTSRDRSSNSE